MILGPVAEASVAPENAVPAPASVSAPYIGPEPGLGPEIQVGTGALLLDQLAFLPVGDIEGFVGDHPGAMTDLLTNPPPSQKVSLWWSALAPEFRDEFARVAPTVVGNLDGLPFAVRDSANRELLADTVAQLQSSTASGAGRAMIQDSERRVGMLNAIEDALVASDGTPRLLLSLDVSGQGRAAVVVGDLATADYVTYLVPGMFFTIEGQMGDWTEIAARLQRDEQAWLERLGAPGSVATVAWIGYETPNLTNVGSIDSAQRGSVALASAVQGLRTQRVADQPFVTILGHSYGATAALIAVTEQPIQVDALAMIGSPGSGAQSVDELKVRDHNVWVGEAAWDPVPNSSFFGSDPGAPSFGAHLMSVDGGTDDVTGRSLSGAVGHLGYFGSDSEAMRNLALISIDRGDLVSN